MLIDWFTVGAQVLNFLVLVWLLKHFLYKPILNAIDAREKGIAATLADADGKTKEARKQQDAFEARNKSLDEQRAVVLSKATDEAKTEHDRLIGEAHKEADHLRATQASEMQADQARLSKEITRGAADEVFGIARKALSDLANTSLEERVGAVFTRRLGQMDAHAKQTMGEALRDSKDPAVVRSAFDLPPEQRATIQNAINETFAADVHIRFETDPDQVCGIELTSNGQKLDWSIAAYLTSLDRKVAALLGAAPDAK